MHADAVLVAQPAIDFKLLIAISHQALGYSVAASSDQARREQHTVERFLSCLAAIRDKNAPAGLTPNLLTFAQFVVLIAADEFDTIQILEAAAGMPFISAETLARGVQLTVVSGTLAQWRDAVVSGTRVPGTVQDIYCRIMSQFEAINLNVWNDYRKKYGQGQQVFCLEDKRK